MTQILEKLRGGLPREPLQFIDRRGHLAVWLPSGEVRLMSQGERLSQDHADSIAYFISAFQTPNKFEVGEYRYDYKRKFDR